MTNPRRRQRLAGIHTSAVRDASTVKALYCYPAGPDECPDNPVIVERVPLRSCR